MKVCFNCTNKESCRFFQVDAIEKDFGSLWDLQIILHSIYLNLIVPSKNISSIQDEDSANQNEKNENINQTENYQEEDLEIPPDELNQEIDSIETKHESTLENEKIENESENENENEGNNKHLVKNKKVERDEEREFELDLSLWNNCSLIMENMISLCEDIADNDGIKFKTYINDIMKEKEYLHQIALLKEQKAQEDESVKIEYDTHDIGVRKERKKMDEIEELIEKITKAKNRKEKRRLLAEFNKNQERIWADARTYSEREEKQMKRMKQNMDNNSNTTAQSNSKNNNMNQIQIQQIEGKKENLDAYMKDDNKDDNKKQTTIMSAKRKKNSINDYEATKDFEQKINMNNLQNRIKTKMIEKNNEQQSNRFIQHKSNNLIQHSFNQFDAYFDQPEQEHQNQYKKHNIVNKIRDYSKNNSYDSKKTFSHKKSFKKQPPNFPNDEEISAALSFSNSRTDRPDKVSRNGKRLGEKQNKKSMYLEEYTKKGKQEDQLISLAETSQNPVLFRNSKTPISKYFNKEQIPKKMSIQEASKTDKLKRKVDARFHSNNSKEILEKENLIFTKADGVDNTVERAVYFDKKKKLQEIIANKDIYEEKFIADPNVNEGILEERKQLVNRISGNQNESNLRTKINKRVIALKKLKLKQSFKNTKHDNHDLGNKNASFPNIRNKQDFE